MKRSKPLSVFVLSIFLSAQPAWALPEGASVVSGEATFYQPSASQLQITTSDQVIINYDQFNIGLAEHVQFIQPSAGSLALNRIIGSDPSSILGNLSANGRVFLINPNGIIFGAQSSIDVNGLVASTLNITDQNFLNNRFLFESNGAAGDILNQGVITAGEAVALMGREVRNEGVIAANTGTIALATGDQVTLDLTDEGILGVALEGDAAAGSVVNTGEIQAGTVLLTARVMDDALKNVINNEGVIEASSLVNDGGVIRLVSEGEGVVANSGTLDVSGGQKGGRVEMTGQNVGLFGDAEIDASGETGGGEVLIGGDYQGKNAQVRNAQNTFMNEDASINADALNSGDGGKVVLWSDGVTNAHGEISAQGGVNGGDGGLIETSGHILNTSGILVNASTVLGKSGLWLLDPYNVTITSGANSNGSFSGASPNVFTASGNAANVDRDDIETSLNAGTSVTISTAGGGVEDGDINVDATITKSAGTTSTLTMTANRDLNVNQAIASTTDAGGLNVTMTANRNIDLAADITTKGGNITMTATTGKIDASVAGVTMNADSADVAIGSGGIIDLTAATSVGATNAINFTADGDSGTSHGGAGGEVNVTSAAGTLNIGTVSAAGGNAIVGGGAVRSGGAGGDVLLAGVGTSQYGDIDVSGGDGNSVDNGHGGAGGSITITGDGVGTITMSGLDMSGGTGYGASSQGPTGGSLFVLADENLVFSEAVTAAGGTGLLSGGTGGTIDITTDGDITFADDVTSGGGYIFVASNTGKIDASTSGVTFNSDAPYKGTVTFALNGGSIDLTAGTSVGATNAFNFSANGADSGYAGGLTSNAGGDAGDITVLAGTTLNVGTVIGNGGDSTTGAGAGTGTGGDGSYAYFEAYDDSEIGNITVNGGDANSVGGGSGGSGGTLDVYTGGGTIEYNDFTGLGGTGYVAGHYGGWGGDILGIHESGDVILKGTMTALRGTGPLMRSAPLPLFWSDGDITLNNASIITDGDYYAYADANGDGVGTYSQDAGSTVVSDGYSEITAADVDLQGTIDTNSDELSIYSFQAGRTIGLGDTAGDMTISGAELGRITTTNLTIGDNANGNITVDGITAANSANISGTLQLTAIRDNSRVIFANNASTFNDLSVSADDGIAFNASVTTLTGDLLTVANWDSAADTYDNITIAGGVTLTAAVDMTLMATNNGVLLSGADGSTAAIVTGGGVTFGHGLSDTNNPNLTVSAGGNVLLSAATTSLGTGNYSFTADSDNNGSGTVTVNGAVTGSSNLTFSGGGTGTNDTLDLNYDVTGSAITIQKFAAVDLAAGVDLTATNGALNAFSNVTAINLSGANATTNVIDGNGDADVNLAALTDTNNPNLTITSEGDLTVAGGTNLGSGTFDWTVDTDADGANTMTLDGDITGTTTLTVNGDSHDTLTENGTVAVTSYTINGFGTQNLTSGDGNMTSSSEGAMTLAEPLESEGSITAVSSGSITSAGSGVDIVSGGDSSLTSTSGVVGTVDNPLEVNVSGVLMLAAGGQVGSISAVIVGETSDGMIHLINDTPGVVIFNGDIVGGGDAQAINGTVAQMSSGTEAITTEVTTNPALAEGGDLLGDQSIELAQESTEE
jgi:filamentous hemagglutinin family protein